MILKKRNKPIKDIKALIALQKYDLYKLPCKIKFREIILDSPCHWTEKIKWAERIKSFQGPRRETKEYYTILYNDSKIAEQILFEKSEKIRGVNNPWFNHKGKYSPYSKKFVKYNSEEEANKCINDTIEKMRNSLRKNGNNNCTLLYWLNMGYSENEAKKYLKERQTTFSLEKCKLKYGVEEGTRIWNERQIKWQATLQNKSEEEKEKINKKKVIGIGSSKSEKELYSILQSYYQDLKPQKSINPSNYAFDMCLDNKIIEYNGDYWHSNPKVYSENYFNKRIKKTAKEIWDRDFKKIQYAKDKGFKVLVIWESDYKANKEKEIEKCKIFLKK